ncbi:unnamed protein product [Sphenostylis stenocarpa]|uniref:Glabrous enhancer-binding protein-like DBD domain-containing protein n=1 Tax=Sphenostylis stenocarpa TaxID=92480 RepID=A0AA86SZY3_9FABA|nr:unnamed protein product [Sphenostylis stenocarpa]
MPQKRKQHPPTTEDPPTVSSSESEEDDEQAPSSQPHAAPAEVQVSSSEEDDTSQDEDDEQRPILPASAPSDPRPKFSSSESESDTDSEPTPAKPKPADQAQTQRFPTPVKSGSKRPASVTEPKRAKKKPTGAPSSSVPNDEAVEDGKKSSGQMKAFQRIWSNEDVLGILKGMSEYISMTGQDPYRYADAFHNFVKKSLHLEASSSQLKEKIRRLRKKFETLEQREKQGLEPRFVSPQDETAYEISKEIWGEGANRLVEKPKLDRKAAKTAKTPNSSATKPKPKPPPEPSAPPPDLPGSENHDGDDVSLLYREISRFQELDKDDMKKGLTLMGESKRKELEGRWKILRHAEMELLVNRHLLIAEQIKLVSEALLSSS